MSISNVANFTIAIVCLCVGVVAISAGSLIYFFRRKERVLEARSIFMAVVTNIVIAVFLIMECINIIVAELGYHSAECSITDIVINILLQALLNLYLLRAWVLLCKFEITSKIQNMRNKTEGLFDGLGGWFIEHRIVLTVKFLFVVHLLTVSVEVLITLLLSVGKDCSDNVNTIYQISFGVMQLFPLVVMSMRLSRHGQDAYGIKNEFVAAAIVWIIGALCFCTFHFWAFDRNGMGDKMSYIVTLSILFLINTFWPLHLAKSSNKSPEFQVHDITTLPDLLANPEGYAVFAKYLAREFAQENLLLWTAVEDYRKDAVLTAHLNPTKCVTLLESIRDKYMVPGSPYEVNLPYKPRQDFLAALVALGGTGVPEIEVQLVPLSASPQVGVSNAEKPLLGVGDTPIATSGASGKSELLLHILDRVQREVTDLLVHDSLPRFLQSPEFHAFKSTHQPKPKPATVTNTPDASRPHSGSVTTRNDNSSNASKVSIISKEDSSAGQQVGSLPSVNEEAILVMGSPMSHASPKSEGIVTARLSMNVPSQSAPSEVVMHVNSDRDASTTNSNTETSQSSNVNV